MQVHVLVQLQLLHVILDIIYQELHVPHVLMEELLVPQQLQFNHVQQDFSELPLVLHVELILNHVQMQVPL